MDEKRQRITEQKTLIGTEKGFKSGSVPEQKTLIGTVPGFKPGPPAEKTREEKVELVTHAPDRQFIAPPGARNRARPEEVSNPHPSRSLWHYTDKHPVVKGKKHVQE
jgi:hypothetical protein